MLDLRLAQDLTFQRQVFWVASFSRTEAGSSTFTGS